MIATGHVYLHDFGAARMPADFPRLRYPNRSSLVRAYYRHVEAEAQRVYVDGGDLKEAPSFVSWRAKR